MGFQDNLATMPVVDHLSGLNILDKKGNVVHHIPSASGKRGSLKLYHALAQELDGRLDAVVAGRGLARSAEHVADAETNPSEHPSIDLLFRVRAENTSLTLKPLAA